MVSVVSPYNRRYPAWSNAQFGSLCLDNSLIRARYNILVKDHPSQPQIALNDFYDLANRNLNNYDTWLTANQKKIPPDRKGQIKLALEYLQTASAADSAGAAYALLIPVIFHTGLRLGRQFSQFIELFLATQQTRHIVFIGDNGAIRIASIPKNHFPNGVSDPAYKAAAVLSEFQNTSKFPVVLDKPGANGDTFNQWFTKNQRPTPLRPEALRP